MPSLDCYFYLDMNVSEDIRRMQCFCTECVESLNLEGAYFWQGSTRGFGEYKITCEKCQVVIHDPEEA